MKTHKLLTAIKLAAIMLTATVMVAGCQTSPLVTDYAIVPTLSKTSLGNVYPNTAVQLKLEVRSDIKGEVDVEYLASGVSGTLVIATKDVRFGEKFKHDFSEPLYMTFTPMAFGNAQVQFRINNERSTTEAKVVFTVNKPAYELAMISDTTVQVGTKASLAFAVHELEAKSSETKARGDLYTITARITKGHGILQVKDKVLVDNSETKVLTKADAPISVDVIKDIETPFYYTSLSSGENNIDFSIIDQYGNSVTAPIKLQAKNPVADFKFSLNQDSSYKAAVLHEFTIFPDTKGVPLDFKLSWTIAKESEIQDIAIMNKVLPLPAGNQVIIKDNSANPLSVITQSTGKMGISFQLEDKYGTKTDTTVLLNIVSPSINFKFPSTFPELTEWKAYEWVGNLLLESGTNAYQIKYENEDPDAGDLLINGILPVYGENADLKSGKNLFRYLPKKVGIHNLLFTVSDKFKNKETYSVKFTVKANSLNITVDKVSPVNYSQSVNINVNIPAQDHIKSFNGLVSSLNGGTANIEVNGSKVRENAEFALKPGTNVFNVTPTKIAPEYKFTLLVKSDIGQEQTQEVVVPIVVPNMNAKLTTLVGTCDLTGTLIYELSISKPHYDGSYSVTPSIISKTGGKINIAGKDVGNNLTATISKSGTVPVVYTPEAKGDINVNLRIADENGQDTVIAMTGQVDLPKLMVHTTPSSATIRYKTLTRFTVTIAEALHSEKFKFTPQFIKGSGALTMENNPILPGVMCQLAAGTYNFTYTPDDCGETEIRFDVTDKYITTASTSIIFTVEPYPLNFTMTNVSASEVNITVPVTFSLAVDENEAPDSPYTLSHTTSNKGTLKLGESVIGAGTSKVLAKGTHALSYTPTATGTHSVTFTLRDMFGQQKTATLHIEAKNAPLNASTSVSNLSTVIKKAANFTISASEADYTDDFKLKVTNSGGGVLTMSGTAVTFGQEVNLRSGTTAMAYTPTALGDHTLSFVVKDKYNQSKEFSVQVYASYADMRVGATGPASMYVNRNATIALSLAEDNYTDNFTILWSGGSGIMKNGATIYTPGTNYSIAGGSTNLTYSPTAIGDHVLKFLITDSYGQSKESSVMINVSHAALSASTTPAAATVYTGSIATTTLSISEAEHNAQFTVRPVISGNGTLTINGNSVASGGSARVNGGNQSIGFTAAASGSHSVTLHVDDANDQTQHTVFTVTANEPEIEATATSPSIYTYQPGEILLNIGKPNYIGTYSVNISRVGNGTLLFDGKDPGSSITVGSGVARFSYAPNSPGNHTITFEIRASDGKTKTVTSNISVNHSKPTLSFNDAHMSIRANEKSSGGLTYLTAHPVVINASRAYYPSTKRLTITHVSTTDNNVNAGMGNSVQAYYCKPGDSPMVSGGTTWTKNGSSVQITETYIKASYEPSSPKNESVLYKMTFKVTDEDGQSSTEVLEYVVNPW